MSEKERTYDIIIPVYGALPYLRQCINSVLKNTKRPYNLVIVDDGSNPIIKEYLRTIKSARIITNKKNLGWLKSCNIGIENSKNDVVLLNSDTLVTKGWLEKMDRCAYSDSRIGMVNPLSNNALFLSLPRSSVFNTIPAGFTVESFAGLVSELSECRYPSIPTALGFCLLIKRKIFDCIGVFDERFELGYGEGDDFCMRAKKEGYKGVCCDNAFVYHYGKKSLADSPDKEVHRKRAVKNKNNSLSYLRAKLLTKISEVSPEYRDKVSIITPVYNREIYLEEAISSVLNQSYSNFELIIVDDGSTDNSLNVAREFARQDKRIIVVALEENRGFARARNEGLRRARGEFITCMDSDDIMLPDAIKVRVEFLNSHPEIDLVFGKIHKVIDKEGNPIENAFSEEIEQFNRKKKDNKFYEKVKKLELWTPGVAVTSMFRRKLLFQIGYYEESLLGGADKDFFFRVFRKWNPAFVPEPIILYRLQESNLSGMVDERTGEWLRRPENTAQIRYLEELLRHYRREIKQPKKVFSGVRLLNVKEGERSMKKIEKSNFNKGSIGKPGSGNNRMLEGPSHVELLLGQIGHMAEVIDRLRLQIKEQQIAIVAKDQHINNLNKAIVAKDQHINNLNKNLNKAIAAKDQQINEAINAKDQQINNLNKAIAAKDQHINNLNKNLNKAIAAKDQHINNLNKNLNKAIAAKDQHINNLNIAIVAKDQHINNLNKNLNKAIAAKDQHINNLNKAIVAKDQHIANLDGFIRDLTGEIVKIKKYSVFYNLLSRFRKELLMWFGKSRK
ncbi:MAG: glycosyltransferase [Elusimicrobiota bacterium]|nr:glycosyltransferase [Elusimicrobiota bacterium]